MVILGIIGKVLYDFFEKLRRDILSIIPIFTSPRAILIYWIIAGLLYTFISYKIIIKLKDALNNRKLKKEQEKQKKEEFSRILKIDVDCLNFDKVRELDDRLSYFSESEFPKKLEKREEIKHRLKVLARQDELSELDERESDLIQSIDEKEAEFRMLEERREEKTQKILERLDAFTIVVYKREGLNKEEIKALKTYGFTEENEFCVLEQKRINILINPSGKQTVQHAFLVWNVQSLLEKNRKISRIISRDSVEADITFEFEGKTFAIEIEVGSLLRKPEQMKSKIGSLNRKYGDRWIFLVSNKQLYPKYNKFGLTATRSDFPKKLEKMLKTS